MDDVDSLLEDIVKECGGFGKFQLLITVIIFMSKISVTWSMLMMAFGGATPDWWCTWQNSSNHEGHSKYTTELPATSFKTCHPPVNISNSNNCLEKIFSTDMNTVVSEWTLVCDDSWITSTITTIQMAGLLISGLLAGQMADTVGRKPTFYLSILLMGLFNACAAFSISWEMFAGFRFLIGVSCGMYLTTVHISLIEFIPAKTRAMVCALPSWPVYAAFYGLLSYLLHDWKYIHFATAISTVPLLPTFWIVPESFRWLSSNCKKKEAEKVVEKIAKLNGRRKPNLERLSSVITREAHHKQKHYSVFDLFANPSLVKCTLLMSFCWLSCGYSYYAIAFGVDQLSGSLYLNMFLLSIIEMPSSLITWFLANRIGRRWTCCSLFGIAAFGGLSVGVVSLTDPPKASELINGFALTSKLGVAGGWVALMTFTTESYPTVIRNTGFGFVSSVSRVGAMVAPQVVRWNKNIPGLLYFLCGSFMLLCAICSWILPETKDKVLRNRIVKDIVPKSYTTPGDDLPRSGYSSIQAN